MPPFHNIDRAKMLINAEPKLSDIGIKISTQKYKYENTGTKRNGLWEILARLFIWAQRYCLTEAL
ncbi:hypothetical protein GCM10027342_08700 [Photobacterium alginatilyticum]